MILAKIAEVSIREFLKYAAGAAALVVVERLALEGAEHILQALSPHRGEHYGTEPPLTVGNPITININSNNTKDCSTNTDSHVEQTVPLEEDYPA